MLEIIILTGIAAVVVGMAVRSFYRIVTGKKDNDGCSGSCKGCACKDTLETNPGKTCGK